MKLRSKFQIRNDNRPSYSLVSTCDIYPQAPVQRPGQSERFYPPVTLWNTNPTTTSIGVGTEYSPSFTLNDASTARQMAVVQPAPAENIPTVTVSDNTAMDIINEAQNQVVTPPDLQGSFPGSVPATTSVVGTPAPLMQTRAGGLATIQEEDEFYSPNSETSTGELYSPNSETSTGLVDITNPVEVPISLRDRPEMSQEGDRTWRREGRASMEQTVTDMDDGSPSPVAGPSGSGSQRLEMSERSDSPRLFGYYVKGYSPNKQV
jgi:hypothetical protein